MQVFHFEPTEVDVPLQRFVRRVVSGEASREEIEQARKEAGLSPIEALVVTELLRREMQTTFAGDVLHPLCG